MRGHEAPEAEGCSSDRACEGGEAGAPAAQAGQCLSWTGLWKVAIIVVLGAVVAAALLWKGQSAGRAGAAAQQRGSSGLASEADNPLDRALRTGRPVLADFGRGVSMGHLEPAAQSLSPC